MDETTKAIIVALIKAADDFMMAAFDECIRLGDSKCPSDPCPFCTAGVKLQTATCDANDLLEANA